MTRAPRSEGMLTPVISARPRPLMQGRLRPQGFRARVLTLFPEMFPGPLGASLTGRALADGLWSLEALDIRAFARDKHRSVDDAPFGGGAGMVMKPEVVAAALDAAAEGVSGDRSAWPVIHLSPRGRPFTQGRAATIAAGAGVTLLCSRFEGVDQRVLDARAVEEISIGDFVLAGGEIAAMAVLEAVLRLRPGVLGNSESTVEESFQRGLLEHPHYTRPEVWEGRRVPEILLSGHHARIAAWRTSRAEALTRERRPDLWRAHAGADGDREQSDAPTDTAGPGGQDKD